MAVTKKKKAKATPVEENIEKPVPGDVYKRTQTQIDADAVFNKELAPFNKYAESGKRTTKYGFAKPGAFLEIVRKRGSSQTTENVPLIAGVYPLAGTAELGGKLARDKIPNEEISKALFEQMAVKRVTVIGEPAEMMGNRCNGVVELGDGHIMDAAFSELPILGLVATFNEQSFAPKGGMPLDVIDSESEYRRLLPFWQHEYYPKNTWCVDIPSERVAHMANDARPMLEALREQTKILGSAVHIYGVHPRWLRYYSDGDMDTQRGGDFGVRRAPYLNSGVRPLLYDGPAWCVGIRLGRKFLPGRVFVNAQGQFICSDWCQREVDKSGGIDLITGKNTKHSLVTWIAGPAMSRFGSSDVSINTEHQVRRLNVKKVGVAAKIRAEHTKALLAYALRFQRGANKSLLSSQEVRLQDTSVLSETMAELTLSSKGLAELKSFVEKSLRMFYGQHVNGSLYFGFIGTFFSGTSNVTVVERHVAFARATPSAPILMHEGKTAPGYANDVTYFGKASKFAQYQINDPEFEQKIRDHLRKATS